MSKEAVRRAASNSVVDEEDFFGSFQCDSCIHYSVGDEDQCAAFDSIPLDIVTDKFIHTKRHPLQDNDIIFEEK